MCIISCRSNTRPTLRTKTSGRNASIHHQSARYNIWEEGNIMLFVWSTDKSDKSRGQNNLDSHFVEKTWLWVLLEGCLTVHLPHEITLNANLMHQDNFILFLARHVSGTYAHHQEHWMLSCSIWFSAQSFWMGGGLESRCVGRSGAQDHHPSKNSVQKTICCYSTSNAPDDGRMYPKHVELRIR